MVTSLVDPYVCCMLQDVSMLLRAAVGKANLGSLDLRYNHIGDTGAEDIATYLKVFTEHTCMVMHILT